MAPRLSASSEEWSDNNLSKLTAIEPFPLGTIRSPLNVCPIMKEKNYAFLLLKKALLLDQLMHRIVYVFLL